MTDIGERLRACDCGTHCKSGCIQEEAAAEIDRLRSERLAFATESEELRQRINTLVAERDAERKTYNDAVADSIADNERLRAANDDLELRAKALDKHATQLEAEIERLRSQRVEWP